MTPQRRNLFVVGGVVAGLLLCCVLACVAGWATDIVEPYLNLDLDSGGSIDYDLATPTTVTARAPIAPRSTPTPLAASSAPTDTVLSVHNATPQEICAVIVAPAAADSWDAGEDLLETPLAPETDGEYHFAAAGAYDALALNCAGAPVGSQAGLPAETRSTLTIGTPGADAQIRLVNQGTVNVCVVAISPAGSDKDAAADLLGGSEFVAPGQERWLFVTPGRKDMVAIDCDGNVISQRAGRELAAQEYTWYMPDDDSHALPPPNTAHMLSTPRATPVAPVSTATPAFVTAGQGEIILTVRNFSPQDICEVLISPTDSGTWGERNLLLAPLSAAGTTTVRFPAAELYDVLIVGCDATPLDSFAELSPSQSYTLDIGTVADEAQIRLINQGVADICVVIIVPAGTDITAVRTADLLGASEVIAAGEARWLFVTPGTKDMLALDCDGNTLSQRQGRELTAQEYTWYVPDADSELPRAETPVCIAAGETHTLSASRNVAVSNIQEEAGVLTGCVWSGGDSARVRAGETVVIGQRNWHITAVTGEHVCLYQDTAGRRPAGLSAPVRQTPPEPCASASLLAPRQPHTTHLPAFESHWYAAAVSAGTTYHFVTSALGAGVDTNLWVYGADCATLLAYSDNRTESDLASHAAVTTTYSGLVYVEIANYGLTAGAYTLTYYPDGALYLPLLLHGVVPGGPGERSAPRSAGDGGVFPPYPPPSRAPGLSAAARQTPPEPCASALAARLWQPYSATLTADENSHWYAGAVSSGTLYHFTARAVGAGVDMRLWVYGADCTTLLAHGDHGGTGLGRSARAAWTATYSGPVYVQIANYGAQPGSYSFTYEPEPSFTLYLPVISRTFPVIEAPDACPSAWPVGANWRVDALADSDVDVYVFTPTQATRYYLHLRSRQVQQMAVSVLLANCNLTLGTTWQNTDGDGIPFDVEEAGQPHYLWLGSAQGIAPGDYAVRVTSAADAPQGCAGAWPLAVGQWQYNDLAVSDWDTYIFTPTLGQAYQFEVQGDSTTPLRFHILYPSCQLGRYMLDYPGSAATANWTLPTAEPYYIAVMSPEDAVGGYEFRIQPYPPRRAAGLSAPIRQTLTTMLYLPLVTRGLYAGDTCGHPAELPVSFPQSWVLSPGQAVWHSVPFAYPRYTVAANAAPSTMLRLDMYDGECRWLRAVESYSPAALTWEYDPWNVVRVSAPGQTQPVGYTTTLTVMEWPTPTPGPSPTPIPRTGWRAPGLSAPVRQTPTVSVTLYLPLAGYDTVPLLRNGDFELPEARYWTLTAAGLPARGELPAGEPDPVLRLGDPALPAGAIPVGYGRAQQTFRLPTDAATLTWAYRLYTEDTVRSAEKGTWWDSFEVYLNTFPADALAPADDAARLARCGDGLNQAPAAASAGLVFCAGRDTFNAPRDSGWRTVTLDVRAYAGRVVTLYFAAFNRADRWNNTYGYVDDVAVTAAPVAIPDAPDTCAAALELLIPTILDEQIAPAGDADWYAVTAITTAQHTVRVDNLSSYATRLELYTAQCAYVLGFDNPGYAWVTWYPAVGQTYRVRVTGLTAAGAPYRLTVTSGPPRAATEAPTGGSRTKSGRGPGHPAPVPQKDGPPPTPGKPPAPATPGAPEPPPPTIPPTAAPGNTPTSSVPAPTPTTPALILLPETGAWVINAPWAILAPVFVVGLGLVLAGLVSVLRATLADWYARMEGDTE